MRRRRWSEGRWAEIRGQLGPFLRQSGWKDGGVVWVRLGYPLPYPQLGTCSPHVHSSLRPLKAPYPPYPPYPSYPQVPLAGLEGVNLTQGLPAGHPMRQWRACPPTAHHHLPPDLTLPPTCPAAAQQPHSPNPLAGTTGHPSLAPSTPSARPSAGPRAPSASQSPRSSSEARRDSLGVRSVSSPDTPHGHPSRTRLTDSLRPLAAGSRALGAVACGGKVAAGALRPGQQARAALLLPLIITPFPSPISPRRPPSRRSSFYPTERANRRCWSCLRASLPPSRRAALPHTTPPHHTPRRASRPARSARRRAPYLPSFS